MKSAIYATIGSIVLVLVITFFIFQSSDYGITSIPKNNSVVQTDSTDNIVENFVNKSDSLLDFNLMNITNLSGVSKTDAESYIVEAEKVISEMQDDGLPVVYVNDSLIEARNAFRTAYYASILRGEINASASETSDARRALTLVNWRNSNYGDVLSYLKSIYSAKAVELYISDSIKLLNQSINSYSQTGLNVSEVNSLFIKAVDSFNRDQINDSIVLLEQTKSLLEKKNEEKATNSLLTRGVQAFFIKYWWHVLIVIAILVSLGIYGWKQIYLYILVERRNRMRAEKVMLKDLLIKAQEDRYKFNRISEFIYKIRTNKYAERNNYIDSNLPALEEKIRKYGKKK